MLIPDDLKYTKEHMWVRGPDVNVFTVGFTQYAAESFGNIVYVGLDLEVGKKVKANASCGPIESAKVVVEILSPITGTIVEINSSIDDAPEQVNDAPYGDGWLFKIESTEANDSLMSSKEYVQFIEAKRQ